MDETVLTRFIRYAKIDTQSMEGSTTCPSTEKQLVLLRLLAEELKQIGLFDAALDSWGLVMATLPGNIPEAHPAFGKVPVLGLIAHVDTSPSVSGANVKPQIFQYSGGDITLPGDNSILIRESENPEFAQLGAAFAYTVDGEMTGELNKETFSADTAIITVYGRNIHPGRAKGLMVNSIRAMADIIVRLPKDTAPETTEGYEPYIHPTKIEGEEDQSTLKILLRDFQTSGLEDLKKRLEGIIESVRPLHPKTRIELEIKQSYRNMREELEKDPRVLDCLEEATKRAGLEPRWIPIRGGTDGSRLTASGMPTPNIFTGGKNFHSKTEWISQRGMEYSVATILNLLQIWVEKSEG
jgi:tripeptide aminopeptidase